MGLRLSPVACKTHKVGIGEDTWTRPTMWPGAASLDKPANQRTKDVAPRRVARRRFGIRTSFPKIPGGINVRVHSFVTVTANELLAIAIGLMNIAAC